MANGSLYDIELSHQEIEAFTNLVVQGLQAFKVINYRCYYEDYLKSITRIVQLSASAVIAAQPCISLYTFSCHLDKFNSAMRQMTELLHYMEIKKSGLNK